MASTITALVIQGATVLPDGADAAIPNGWVAKATLPWDAAATFDPTKIVLTVTDPGFASDGTAATRTRTIRGGAIIRKQYPNQASRLASQVSSNLEVYFSLTDDIYAGSTITVATADAGYYGAAAAGSIAGVVNSSSISYPKPLFGWLNRPHERATGSGFSIEAVAYHRHAMNGQQVACIEFTARDAQGSPNSSAMQRATTPALSDFQTKGQRVEAWKASIPLTALTQGDVCQVTAVVKPWLGEAWNLDDVGIAWPTSNPQTWLRFLNDKTGGYGGGHAAVKAGATGGTAQSTRSAAEATPYPTILAALTALKTWNNTNKGHNDHSGGTVWLLDDGAGGAVEHEPSGNMDLVTAGNCLTEIRASPSNTALASVKLEAIRKVPAMLSWHVDIRQTASNYMLDGGINNANIIACYSDGTWTQVTAGAPVHQRQIAWVRNLTHSGVDVLDVGGGPTVRHELALLLGYVNTNALANRSSRAHMVIGCDMRRVTLLDVDTSVLVLHDSQDGKIVANNKLMANQAAVTLAATNAITRGLAFVQNVVERSSVSNPAALFIGADGATSAFSNVVIQANSVVGDRMNIAYADVAGAAGVEKRATTRYNLLDQRNTKSDLFTTNTTVTGRTRNWRYTHNVGNDDTVMAGGGAGGPPGVGSWIGEYWEKAQYEVGRANVGFVDDKGGSARAGGGDYALTGDTNAAYARVPAGAQVLARDIIGNVRRNDGTGAAGAYERAGDPEPPDPPEPLEYPLTITVTDALGNTASLPEFVLKVYPE